MSISDRELEEAGRKLLDPPSSVHEILSLLDKVEHLMSKIEQSPPCPTMCELYPLIGALVSPKLFKHSDSDVKLAVAACICQITFITAPDLTYDDDQMKEVFQLIVSSFEHLSDIYSRSYTKSLSILETVHDVKLSRVMLNLECDALLVEMFQHFLNGIRDHHPGKLFSSMEHIMTLVVEESDDVPPQLLSPILHYVRKDDKQIPQVSRKLAEQVLINCASKLKTYLADAVKSSGISLDKYSNIVASICEGALSALKQNGAVADKKEVKFLACFCIKLPLSFLIASSVSYGGRLFPKTNGYESFPVSFALIPFCHFVSSAEQSRPKASGSKGMLLSPCNQH
ncbi:unnamed protein product [Arabidopsis halleri]